MRVTLVTETYFPQVNGVSRTLSELVRFLTQNGDDVQLIYPDYGMAVDGERGPSGAVDRPAVLQGASSPAAAVCHGTRAIESFRPDVIHIATEATFGWSVLRRALRRRLAVVSSFHTNFDQYSLHYGVGWARALIWRYLRWFHNNTMETYVPSEKTIADLESRGFERAVLWRRGVDSSLFRPDRPGRHEVRRALGWSPDDVVISYVSRIAAKRTSITWPMPWRSWRRNGPMSAFSWLATGRLGRPSSSGSARFAHFAGYLQGEKLSDYYAASDIFAFSSLTETFGNVVLEAMASGLPVVAVRAGGVGETVRSGRTGILIEPSEPPATFASALLGLIDRPETRSEMAQAAREYALSQSWDAIMGGLRERYQRVIDERTRTPEACSAAR